jgi:AcrR family transcriptional regulator
VPTTAGTVREEVVPVVEQVAKGVRRAPLSRERVLRAAVALADADGVRAVTMRSVGEALGVEGMALYRHVANKDALLDGLVESVLVEMTAGAAGLPAEPGPDRDWRQVVRARVLAARATMLRHPWAPALVAARGTPGTSTLSWYEELCAALFAAGFSDDLVHHALHALGSRALGFHLEVFSADAPEDPDTALAQTRELTGTMPSLARVVAAVARGAHGTAGLGGCDDDTEFAFGLDVVLDGLEARRAAGWTA